MLKSLKAFLKPSKTIPKVSWSNSGSNWSVKPYPFLVLVLGLWIFGTGEAMLINSSIGVSPWTVLAEGVAKQLSVGIGVATFIVGTLVLLLWIPLKQRPGLGTIMNILVISTAIDLMGPVLPNPDVFALQLMMVVAGVALVGVGSAFYLTANYGPGPRDGWMTGLHYRTGIPVGKVRLGIELTVLLTGWILGGTVGIGTAIFALFIGQAIAVSLGIVSRKKPI